jgi:nucleolar complex protein 3
MRKRAAANPSAEPETTPRQAPALLEMELAPTLPVYSAGDGVWRATAQQATLPAVAVQGVTVLDDLAQAAAQQAPPTRDLQKRHDEQHGQRPASKRHQLAANQQPAGVAADGMGGLQGIESCELRRQAAKEQLALAAQKLLQDPEKQLPELKGLLDLMHDEDPQVCRLTMLTLLAVFKDLIPAYRIRPVADEAPEQLSKEVRALRAHESALLDSYHAYLKALLRAFKASNAGDAPIQQGRVAAKCMAGLLEAAPHFNYRSGGQIWSVQLPEDPACMCIRPRHAYVSALSG